MKKLLYEVRIFARLKKGRVFRNIGIRDYISNYLIFYNVKNYTSEFINLQITIYL